jgi:amidase
MASLHDLTALDQAAAIRAGEVSPTDLTAHYLDRIASLDDRIGAYLTVTAELATEQAIGAEDRLKSDPDPRGLPPLFGVPIAVKDVTRIAGVRCTYGSAAFSDYIADADDHVVTKLRTAGTVFLGKTNTPEFALTCYTENRLGPPTRNPWDLERSPGGSSGGSGAAVAAGLAPVAQGTDHGGSIRIPASACGIVGIKPGRGRVSNGPGGEYSGMSTNGPLARTVADAAALLDAMAGPMPGDAVTAPPAGGRFLDCARRNPGRLRVAVMETPLLPAQIHPDCREAQRQTAEVLASLGHEVAEVKLPDVSELADAFISVMSCIAAVPNVTDESLLMPFTRTLRMIAEGVCGQKLARALTTYQAVTARLESSLFTLHDVVLSPTLATPPPMVGGLRNDENQDAEFSAQASFMPFTPLYNPTGLPSMSVPSLWNPDGLPIGVMLSGRHGGEGTLISVAAQIEAARPWADRKPGLW